jgi:hypothetical protein
MSLDRGEAFHFWGNVGYGASRGLNGPELAQTRISNAIAALIESSQPMWRRLSALNGFCNVQPGVAAELAKRIVLEKSDWPTPLREWFRLIENGVGQYPQAEVANAVETLR